MSKMVQVAELSICNSEDELILENISFNVDSGSISQLSGLSSFQYRVLFNILCGELEPDSGQIVLSGRNVVRLNDKKRKEMLKKEVSFLPENLVLPEFKTAKEALEFKLGVIGDNYELEQKISDTLHSLEFENGGDILPGEMDELELVKERVALALINEPNLMICHDPFIHLSPGEEGEMLNLLTGLAENKGLTVLILTENLKNDVGAVEVINS